jgi:pre-mRNA-splicing factor CDC5/CEF1
LTELLKRAKKISDPAAALIAVETAALMAHDATRFPLNGSQVKGKLSPLAQIDDGSLADARLRILSETKPLPSFEDTQAAFESRAGGDPLLLGLGCYNDDDDEQDAAMRAAFDVSLGPLKCICDDTNQPNRLFRIPS